MRRVILLLAVAGIVALFWSGTGSVRRGADLRAVVVFDSKQSIAAGDPVIQDGEEIGRVEKISSLDGRPAVTVEIEDEHRRALRSDSLIRVTELAGRRVMEVDSNFAVGRPLEDGAVLRARDHRLAQWLEKSTEAMAPTARRWRDSALSWVEAKGTAKIDEQINAWKGSWPEWKREGGEAFERRVADAKATAAEWERELRKTGREADADRVKRRMKEWLAETGSESKR